MKTSFRSIFGIALLAGGISSIATADYEFAAEPLWTLSPGESPIVGSEYTERGMGYNPTTGNVLLVSRLGGLTVHIIDGATGEVTGTLPTPAETIAGGTFALSTIGVAADGAIYGANLTLDSAADPFKVYRWENETADPTVFYSGNPSSGSARFGDNFAVRGSGSETQVLAATRNGIEVALIMESGATLIEIWEADSGDFGLGVAFGSGNTFWGSAGARPLRHVDFDGNVIATYSSSVVASSMTALAVDTTRELVAGVRFDAHDVFLYNAATLSTEVLNNPLNIAAFPTQNANINGTGAAVFADGILYALDTNNGIIALEVADPSLEEDFSSWITQQAVPGDQQGQQDDPDGDGLSNLVEYALGGDPAVSDQSIAPAQGVEMDESDNTYLSLGLNRNPDATGIALVIEVSNDLSTWNSGVDHTTTIVDSEAQLVVRDNTPISAQTRRFMRLSVVEQ